MVYSYTQISQYLRCPRSYRYRYLDGWREKETRAAMVFGRCFENALSGPTFVAKIAVQRCSRNGAHTAMLRSNTKGETPGTGWCTRASICWRGSHRTTEFVSATPGEDLQVKMSPYPSRWK